MKGKNKMKDIKKTWIVQTPFSSPFGPFHDKVTARKWSDIVKCENPKFRYDVNVVPLHYVNSDPFSSATIVLTKVKNNRKRINSYEYTEA